MVTLSILKFLENNGFGKIDQNLFWEKMGLDKVGLYITDLGGSTSRTSRPSTTFQIFSRGRNDVEGYQTLQKVAELLNSSFSVCTLPAAPPVTDYGYSNVSFSPVSTIANDGVDMNGRVIYSITGTVYHGAPLNMADPPQLDGYVETEEGNPLLTENEKTLLL